MQETPVMWFNESQMSGDVIYMKTDFETKKIGFALYFWQRLHYRKR